MKKLLASLALALLVLAGCSDSDEPSVSTDGTGSASEPSDDDGADGDAMALDDWIEEADAICEAADEDIEALGEPESEEEFVEYMGEAAELFVSQLDDLKALGIPDDKADEVEEAFDLLDQQSEMLEEMLEVAEDEGAEAVFEMMEEGDELEEQLDELAADIGLEACGADDDEMTEDPGSDDPGSDDPGSDDPGSDDPGSYGDDAALDELWDECDGGNGAACDELYWDSPLDSEYEAFGSTCGGRYEEGEGPVSCEEDLGGDKIEDDGGTGGGAGGDESMSYGDDPVLDALYDSCAEGDMAACDDLFWDSPLGSEYEAFGNTCGELFSEDEVPFSCAEGE